jgi:UDP-N-acetylmuramoyl-L-alanyl-D-glutamate--2,6-diaminopimelate ligase
MNKDDILLILGKGHEDYQIIGHTKYHLDDAEEVQNWKKEA